MFCKDTKEATNNTALIVAIRLDLLNQEDTEDPEWLKNLWFFLTGKGYNRGTTSYAIKEMPLPIRYQYTSSGLPSRLSSKERTCQRLPAPASAGDMGLIPVSGRSLEEGNGNSSRLAWEIPWTAEPGGLQSIGSQSVRHNSVTKQQQQHIYYNDQNPEH